MGAHGFVEFHPGPDCAAAYRAACEQALYEHGHDGYNGTISTTDGVSVVQATPLPQAVAERLAESKLEQFSKWGPVGAVAVGDPAAYRLRSRTLTITTEQQGPLYHDTLLELARAQLTLQPGETIASVKLLEEKAARSVVSESSKGKAVTRYRIARDGTLGADEYPTLAAATQAARAAAKQVGGERWPVDGDVVFEIVGSVRRENGAALRTLRSQLRKRTLKLAVELVREQRSATTVGWVFFGWAAS